MKLLTLLLLLLFGAACAVEAHPLDKEQRCWQKETEVVGFYLPDIGGCHEGDAKVEDDDGNCWYFINGCVPNDLEETSKCGIYDPTNFCK